jgi:DNA-directed RNA polymerase specialized sigma24 family protein
MPTISDDTLARARRLDARAAEEVVAASYPAVCRIARALLGSDGAFAGRVVADVMRQSLRVMPRWREGTTPENWYYHHTVLTVRAAYGRGPALRDPRQDALVARAPAGAAEDVRYVALVRALRGLPEQQMEAFILNHGERLNERLLGVAMDCSSAAAANHLRAAEQAMAAVSGGAAGDLAGALHRAYMALTPAEPQVRADVRGQVRRALRPVRVRRVVRLLLTVLVLLAVAYALWHWRDRIPPLIDRLKGLRKPT